MALNWNFKEDKMGTITERGIDGKEYTYNIYNGNAFAIFLYEWEEDGKQLYHLRSFFGDERHAKNCLGLSKEYKDCMYEEGEIVKVTLNPKARNAKKLAELFVKTGLDITIEMKKEA